MRSVRNIANAALLGCVAGAASGTVHAQSSPAVAADSSSLQEVVVTARRRDEKLLDVPEPVTAINAATIELTQAVSLEDYLTQVPGVSFDQARAGQTKVTFRGINAGDVNATVVTYIDNIPITPSGPGANSGYITPNLDPSDLAQIEVDRGPQGTLYGANAIGGVLKYVTVKPDPNNFSGRVEVSGAGALHGDIEGAVRAALNLPLIADTLALRISGFDRKDPGYIDDPNLHITNVNGERVSGGRAALLWNVSSDFTVNASALTQQTRSRGNNDVDYNPFTGQTLYGDLTHERYYYNEYFDSRYGVYNVDLQWDLHWARLLSSTSYSTLNNGGDLDLTNAYGPLLSEVFQTPNLGFDNPLIVHGKKFTEEVRLTSSDKNKLEWQVGVYFTRDRTEYDQSANLFDIPTQAYVNDFGYIFDGYLKNQYIEHSGFGNVDYHFTSQFDVSLGIRYSEDNQNLHTFFRGLLIGPTEDSFDSTKEHAITWAVNPRYKITDDEMVYARVATGYRPGGTGVLPPGAAEAGLSNNFKPDHLTSYEAGWKASLFDRSVTVDFSVYYIRWTDVQENIVIGSFSTEGNGGRAHSQGIETALTWTPLQGLNLLANFSFNENRLDSDDSGNPDLSQAGNRLPGTPKFSANFSADYKWALTQKLDAYMGASAFYTAARPDSLILGYNPNNASGVGAMPNFGPAPIYDPNTNALLGYTNTQLPGYTRLDLRSGLSYGDWTVEAFVKNATDVRAYSEAYGLNNSQYSNYSTQWTAVVLPPRTIGVSLARKF